MPDDPQPPASVIASCFNRCKGKMFGMQFGEQAVIDLRAAGWTFTRIEDAETQEPESDDASGGK